MSSMESLEAIDTPWSEIVAFVQAQLGQAVSTKRDVAVCGASQVTERAFIDAGNIDRASTPVARPELALGERKNCRVR
jgi:hypothetical protein